MKITIQRIRVEVFDDDVDSIHKKADVNKLKYFSYIFVGLFVTKFTVTLNIL